MQIFLILLLSALIVTGCKKTGSKDSGGSSSGLASVDVAVPDAIVTSIGAGGTAALVARGFYNEAEAKSGKAAPERRFVSAIALKSSGGTAPQTSRISFQDEQSSAGQNRKLAVGNTLGGIRLDIMSSDGQVVYSGPGEPGSTTITAGENRLKFSLKCMVVTLCPKGGDNYVVNAISAPVNSGGQPATIVADVQVDPQSGANFEGQKNSVLACGGKIQSSGETCEDFAKRYSEGVDAGVNACQRISAVTANPSLISQGSGQYGIQELLNMCVNFRVLTPTK